MNASLPPDDDRRDAQEGEAHQELPAQTVPRIGLGTLFGLFVAVGMLVLLLLPAIQSTRDPAPRSTRAELELRQQAIEQAAREASNEDGLADYR